MDQSDQELVRFGALLNALPVKNPPMTLGELDGNVVGVACSTRVLAHFSVLEVLFYGMH